MRTPRTKPLSRRVGMRLTMLVCASALLVPLVAAPAGANAANPNPDTTGSATVNADGSVTATLSGTWSWPNQSCAGRYGEGWAVDWWGLSSSQTPNPSFSLTNATEVTGPGVTTTGTISPAGAIAIKNTHTTYFHVGQYYAGEVVNSPSTCTDVGNGSAGAWSASATYPSMADVPPQVCVNMYDEHGSEGKASKNTSDYSPSKDSDNSILTNAFNPSDGYCTSLQVQPPPKSGWVEVCKASGTPAVTGNYQFVVDGNTYTVPVGACTSAIAVPVGTLHISEVHKVGTELQDVSTVPTNRLVSWSAKTRSADVTIPAGGPATQTIVTFTNRAQVLGRVKICDIAGPNITVGTMFTFDAGGKTVQVPAGPSSQGGYCVLAGRFHQANNPLTITEVDTTSTVTSITVQPRNRKVSVDLPSRTVQVNVYGGVTEVTYTNN